ncbi:MAG TPA: DUF4097 family beta strand repeat-containing protein [Terriglobia bacterium]|nr:DUF4097 family beta strand repeat-containing protein [Terriglobia bacterium]
MSAYSYRRGSIFWALTLIAVGFIFLYQNFNPSIHPWHILAKFWPVLIIFWGISKLIDHLQARLHPETVPAPLFSGGEVVLLLMILILGTIVSRIVLRPWHQWGQDFGISDEDWGNMFANSYTYTDSLSQPVKGQPSLIIEDQNGDLEIRGTDQPRIDVAIKKVIHADDEAAARKLSDQLKVEIVEEAGHYQLRSNRRSLPDNGRQVRLDLTVRVPKAASTQITSEHGDLLVDGLHGDQTLNVLHGDLHVSNVDGLVRIHKSGGSTDVREVKGNVEVDGRSQDISVARVQGTVTVKGEYPGTVEFEDITQSLRFTSSRTDLDTQKLSGRLSMETGSLEASGVDGPFQVTTREKDIQINGFKHAVKISDTNGDINLTAAAPPAHPIEVESKKGEIELTLPANSSFTIDATSRQGEVQSDFSAPTLKLTKEGDTPKLEGSYGKGGPTIRLATAYGTVRVTREGAGSPSAPTPPSKPAPPSEPGDETRLRPRSLGPAPVALLSTSN